MQNGYFIGYATLEALLEAVPANSIGGPPRLNVSASILQTPSSLPQVRFLDFRVVVSFAYSNQDPVRYWQMLTGRCDDWGNDAPSEKRDAADKRTQKAKSLIVEYLKGHWYAVDHAIVATPKDLRMMDGTTDIIEYAKDFDTYVFGKSVMAKGEAG